MNRRSFVLVATLVMVLAAGVAAQSSLDNPMTEYPQALGGAFGPIIGTGLSYQRWFDTVGLQTGFGIVYQPVEYQGELLWYLATVSGQRILYRETFADWFAGGLYAFGGLAHEGRIPQTASYDDMGNLVSTRIQPFEPYIAAGVGVGIESILFRHFSIPVEFGLSAQWLVPSILPVSAGFVGGVGLRYRF